VNELVVVFLAVVGAVSCGVMLGVVGYLALRLVERLTR
jgi:hypothetical protein